MFNKKPVSILYLDSDSFTYFAEGNIELKFTYPSASIKALEIIDEQLLVNETTRFIQSNKIVPTTMMFILSSELLYEKEFPDQVITVPDKKEVKIPESVKTNTDAANTQTNTSLTVNEPAKTEQNEEVTNENVSTEITKSVVPLSVEEQRAIFLEERSRQIQAYIDIVPIEEVASKIYKKDKSVKIVVTNKKLYEIFVKIFTKQMFIVDSVVPSTVISKEILAEPVINKDTYSTIVKRFDTVRQYSLFEENSYALTRAATEPHGIQMTTKVTSKREYVLIGVFGCLILVLGIISYTTFISPAKDRKVASITKTSTPPPFPSPTLMPSITPTGSQSAELTKETVSIQIKGGTNSQTNLLQNAFLDNGFLSVVTAPNNKASTGRVLIVFSPLVSESLKTQVLNELRKSVLNVTVQESPITEFNIIINL